MRTDVSQSQSPLVLRWRESHLLLSVCETPKAFSPSSSKGRPLVFAAPSLAPIAHPAWQAPKAFDGHLPADEWLSALGLWIYRSRFPS